ncbi:MAG: precorrin-2 C(20)-methyltransferase [Chloroflexota bacterium]
MIMTTDNNRQYGRLYGVGIGPGDPELVTLKAQRILNEVAAIFVPKKSAGDKSIAESVITGLQPHLAAKVIGIVLPMLRDEDKLREHWRRAAECVWSHLERGEDGAFVNVGDPLFYGTFIHVMGELKNSHPEIEIEIVPGVSSINAAAARTAVPLGSDDDNIAVISGDQPESVIRNALENFATVVFLKVNTVFARLVLILEDMDLADKSIYVKRCTTGEEEIVRDIRRLPKDKADYFSLVIVRK